MVQTWRLLCQYPKKILGALVCKFIPEEFSGYGSEGVKSTEFHPPPPPILLISSLQMQIS